MLGCIEQVVKRLSNTCQNNSKSSLPNFPTLGYFEQLKPFLNLQALGTNLKSRKGLRPSEAPPLQRDKGNDSIVMFVIELLLTSVGKFIFSKVTSSVGIIFDDF